MGSVENYRIRRMKKADLAAVEEIERASFPMPWDKDAFEQELTNPCGHYLVLEQNGEILAMGGMWLILGEGQITTIAVRPDCRGMGYGRAVLRALLRAAYDELHVSDMSLEVRPSNLIARNLYESMGFIAEGRRKHYYEDNGEDALILWNHDTTAFF